MSERVYLTLERDWNGYAPEIGLFILAYLEIRLGLSPTCKYLKEHGTTYVYLICGDEAQALRVYNLLTPNSRGAVFSEIRLRKGYRTDGRDVEKTNGILWHDRAYRIIRSCLSYTLEHDPNGSMGRRYELTRAIRTLEYE